MSKTNAVVLDRITALLQKAEATQKQTKAKRRWVWAVKKLKERNYKL